MAGPVELHPAVRSCAGPCQLGAFSQQYAAAVGSGPAHGGKYGSIPLLKGILFTALVTGVLQCILFPNTGLLGASGIVFMLIMLSSLAGFSGGIPVTMLLVAALYFGQQVYDIIFVHDNVANFMHIVGGLCGTAFGYYCALHRRPARSRR